MTKPILLLLGHLSVALALIGAVLPIMPTTPFAILAAYFYSKSSPRLHQWILNLKYIGPEIRQWEENRVIRPKAKALCLVTIFAMFGMTFMFVRTYLWAKIIMLMTGVGISIFVLTRKSYPDQKKENGKTANITH